jgi:hypothetical protein
MNVSGQALMRLGIAAVVAVLLTSASGAFAQTPAAIDVFTVTKSSVAAISASTKFARGSNIELAEGAKIDFTDSKGAQFVCVGPYKGLIEICPGPAECTVWRRVAGQCGAETQTKAGGTRTLGGTLGGAKPAP